jgi:hypothetical protein
MALAGESKEVGKDVIDIREIPGFLRITGMIS